MKTMSGEVNGGGEVGEVELAAPSGFLPVATTGTAAGQANSISLVRLIFACIIAGGVQYGWALQLSLLTPYVQTLGVPHSISSLMWLCGPVAGFVVQPTVGLWSDRCTSRFGRRRPFILAGCLLICTCVVVIGWSADIGFALGDTKEHCSVYHGRRLRAAIIYVIGFWVLDLSNNAVQGPARALMADINGKHGPSKANAIFCSWMAFGNVLGYAAGSSNSWHKWFPFLMTKACCDACANLKGAFLVAEVVLLSSLAVTLIVAKEKPLSASKAKGSDEEEERVGMVEIFKAFKNLPPGMPAMLCCTALTWFSWFPFILYDTDWMGREIYHGNTDGTQAEIDAYNKGVREGAFGLLLNSVVVGITSFIIEPLCRKLTARIVWVTSNFLVCILMAAIAIISTWSLRDFRGSVQQVITADNDVKAAALVIFALLGVPLAVLYSVPWAVAAQLASTGGGGQGLCTGVLNISIVVPQIVVALSSGPWDALFGSGNIPAFAAASAFAFISGVVGIALLPRLSGFKTAGLGGGH